MDLSFIPIEVVPQKGVFDLDTLRRSYKTSLTAEDAIAAAPAIGDADETFATMFLVDVNTPESAESATRIDLVYRGTFENNEGAPAVPVLPASKHQASDAVQSSSSVRTNTGVVLEGAATIEFYAPSNTLTYFSYEGVGTDEPEDPADDIRLIRITIGDATFDPGSPSLQEFVNLLFVELITKSHTSDEVVPGKFWLNSYRKTKNLSAWIFSFPSGPQISLYSPGVHYVVGDDLTISSGGESAVIEVTAIGAAGGGITNFSVTSNTFTVPHNALYATGGSGSNAAFNVFIIS